jgi:hypothetical protein
MGAEVLLDAEEPVAQLEEYFGGQLEREGWVRQARGGTGPLAWSQWWVSGPEGPQAWLFALDTSTPGRRVIVLRMERDLDDRSGTPGQFLSQP